MKLISAILVIVGACFIIECGPGKIQKRPVSRETQFEAIRLMREGDLLLQEGKEHLAMLKYLDASQVNPYEERAFNKLAITYLRLKRYYEARRAVNRAIGLNQNYAHAYNTQGILDLADNSLKAASRSFRKAIKLEPEVPSFHVNLGFTEVRRRNMKEAFRAYEKANELNPDIFENQSFVELDSGGPIDSTGHYEFALVFGELGKLDLCLWYLRKAISSGFDDFDRIVTEPVLQKFNGEEEYQEFLRDYGVTK